MTTDPAQGEGQQEQHPDGMDARLSALEAEQKKQGGTLQTILSRLPGGSDPKGSTPPESGTGSDSPETSPSGPSIREQIRQGVAEIEAEKAAKAKTEGDESRLAAVEQALKEQAPQVPQTGRRSRLQRIMYGPST